MHSVGVDVGMGMTCAHARRPVWRVVGPNPTLTLTLTLTWHMHGTPVWRVVGCCAECHGQ